MSVARYASKLAALLGSDGKVSASGLNLTTPAQFDNSVAPATTAFVQRALGNFNAANQINSLPTTLTASAWGQYVAVNASGGTITLPTPNVSGGSITFNIQSGLGNTVSFTTPSGLIYGEPGVAATITLKAGGPGTSYQFVCDGANWIVVGGNGALSGVANGYQVFSNGFIIQWGSYTVGNGGGATRSFNIAFPNNCFGVFNTHIGGQSGTYDDGYSAIASITTSNYRFVYDTSRCWLAIGN